MTEESNTAPLDPEQITCVDTSDPAVISQYPLVSDCELADEAWRELKDNNARIRLWDLVYHIGAKHASIRATRRLKNALMLPQA